MGVNNHSLIGVKVLHRLDPIPDIDIRLRNLRLDRSRDTGENVILVLY